MDATKLGQVTAELMETLEEECGEESELGICMVLVEVKDGDEDATFIRWRCSDPRWWIQRGMLHAAIHADEIRDELDDEDEDEDDD